MRGAVIPELATEFRVSKGLLGLLGPAGTLGYVVAIAVVGTIAAHSTWNGGACSDSSCWS
ncbi:hypothetical protein [Halorhabdus salina]|uniref:hypothetical protein n=1 Tax=Halorhabdus salina TaxID=2750670 RepID=UPI001C66B793|nr:hypothetical protein [Halorhabdus salina]